MLRTIPSFPTTHFCTATRFRTPTFVPYYNRFLETTPLGWRPLNLAGIVPATSSDPKRLVLRNSNSSLSQRRTTTPLRHCPISNDCPLAPPPYQRTQPHYLLTSLCRGTATWPANCHSDAAQSPLHRINWLHRNCVALTDRRLGDGTARPTLKFSYVFLVLWVAMDG